MGVDRIKEEGTAETGESAAEEARNAKRRHSSQPLTRIFHTRLDPMHFTEGTEPSPQKSQNAIRVWLRDLGSDLCALCEKRFSSEKCD